MSDLVDQWKIILFGSTIVLLYQVIKDFKKSQRNKSKQKKGIKICLTGGPCGGVTEGIQEVNKLFGKRRITTYIVPQAATILGSGGGLLNFNYYNEQQIINFQYNLMKIQIGLEDIMTNISNIKAVQQPVILCDRGLLDGKAYMGNFLWKKMLERYNLNQKDLLDRYGYVIHMVTIADGYPQLFKAKSRKQSLEEAIKIDNLIKKSWQKHPNLYVIGNEFVQDFQIKKCFLVNYIYQNIISKIFGEGRLRKQKKKIVQQAYYSYLQRKEKLRKRQLMKRQRKLTQKIE